MSMATSLRRPLNGFAGGCIQCRSLQMIARTINLTDAKSCRRPKRVQRLESADVKSTGCPHSDALHHAYPRTRIVPIRICRREDLERACQPKFCECPQKPPPVTTSEILCNLSIFGAKGLLAAGLVYWTVAEGIWGDPSETEDFYTRLRETFTDLGNGQPQLPRLQNMKYKILDSYNRAVIAIITTSVEVPRETMKKIKESINPCIPIDDDPKKKKKR